MKIHIYSIPNLQFYSMLLNGYGSGQELDPNGHLVLGVELFLDKLGQKGGFAHA